MPGTSTVAERVGVVLLRTTGVLVLLTVTGIVLAPRMPVWSYSRLGLVLGLVAVVAGAYAAAPHLARRTRHLTTRGWDVLAVLVSLPGLALAGAVAWGNAYRTTWDVESVRRLAEIHGAAYTPADVGYLERYPHNFGIIAIGRLAFASGWGYETFFGVLNVLLLAVAAASVYLLVRMLRSPAAGVGSLVALWFVLGSSPWLAVPYTDTLVLASPAVAVLLFALGQRRRGVPRIALRTASGLVLGATYPLKPTVVVGVIALCLVVGHQLWQRRERVGPALGSVAGVLAAFALAVPVVHATIRHTAELPPVQADHAAPTLVFIAMGNKQQVADKGGARYWYGGFDPDLEHATYGRPADVQDRLALRSIQGEWDRRGIGGTLGFWTAKTLATWGDGMFFDRAEGYDLRQPLIHHDPVTSFVASWNAPGGALHGLRVLVAQVAWVALLLAVGVGLLRARPRPELVLMALMVLGIAGFVVLFLSRSRHLLPYVPVLVVLAGATLPRRPDGAQRRTRAVSASTRRSTSSSSEYAASPTRTAPASARPSRRDASIA